MCLVGFQHADNGVRHRALAVLLGNGVLNQVEPSYAQIDSLLHPLPCFYPTRYRLPNLPTRLRSLTIAGRSSIDTDWEMTLRLLFLPLR